MEMTFKELEHRKHASKNDSIDFMN